MTFNPEVYLESCVRELKRYTEYGLDASVKSDTLDPIGLEVYEVVMEFPGQAIEEIRTMPLQKTLIHFEIDDHTSSIIGMGDNFFAENYDSDSQTNTPQEGRVEIFNFDVGIWATDTSGGTTSRLRAQQALSFMFSGSIATNRLRQFTDGGDGSLELLNYSGGRFVTERVGDVDVYRMIGAELEIRVFSRTPTEDSFPTIESFEIEEITQSPDLG